MPGLNPFFDPFDTCDLEAESTYTAYNMLFLLVGLAAATGAFARLAESNNRLNYDNRFARIIAGTLMFITRLLHTRPGDLELDLSNTQNALLAIGPHRTAFEALVVASKIKGTPPRFFATDAYNSIPGVPSFMKMFKAIPVEARANKSQTGQNANDKALEIASETLTHGGCVAIFPQGNFARLGQKPPRVYAGAAKLALKNQVPIHVIRLDGFWSLQNPAIPLFIRNNAYYRAFLSAFHMNNVRTTLCCVIDFHLNRDVDKLSEKEQTEIIDEICAQLYAFYRHTGELSKAQIDTIKTEISSKRHLLIWGNKVQQDSLGKQLSLLEKTGAELEEDTLESMRQCL